MGSRPGILVPRNGRFCVVYVLHSEIPPHLRARCLFLDFGTKRVSLRSPAFASARNGQSRLRKCTPCYTSQMHLSQFWPQSASRRGGSWLMRLKPPQFGPNGKARLRKCTPYYTLSPPAPRPGRDRTFTSPLIHPSHPLIPAPPPRDHSRRFRLTHTRTRTGRDPAGTHTARAAARRRLRIETGRGIATSRLSAGGSRRLHWCSQSFCAACMPRSCAARPA